MAGPTIGLDLRRLQQRGQILGHAIDGRRDHFVLRQPGGIDRFEAVERLQIHAVFSLAVRAMITMRAKPRPYCRRVPSVLAKYLVSVWPKSLTLRGEDAGILLETRRRACACARSSGSLSKLSFGRLLGVHGGFFAGEIVGLVLLRHLHLRVGLDLDEPLGGGAIGAIGFEPEAAPMAVGSSSTEMAAPEVNCARSPRTRW